MDFPLHLKEPLDMLIERGDALTPIKVTVKLKKKHCDICNTFASLHFTMGDGGYTVHERHDHAPDCRKTYCEHGKLLAAQICHDCAIEDRNEERTSYWGHR